MKRLLNLLKPKPQPFQPTIESYGQSKSGVEQPQVQSIMEWLFASLLNASYLGKSHIVWDDETSSDPSLERVMKKAMHRGEPVFLHSCGRIQQPPKGYYWRIMPEHPSGQIYQLEVKEDR